ncbi:MAG: helix-turn-helix domain-containing protein, partial [Propionicimonas sp.]|nr:helix-turn-helix domain-containing protein [Propionicimonas sp.]
MPSAELDHPSQSRVPAVDRAVTIRDQVARDGRPLQLAELTRQVALPKSTVFAVCQALVAERLLSRGVDGS